MKKKWMFFNQASTLSLILLFFFVLLILPGHAAAYTEDFENGAAGWTTEGTWALIATDYHSFNHCMTDSPDGNYLADAYAALISPPVRLPTATSIVMTFWNHYQFGNHNGTSWDDYGYVQITTDGGVTWTNLTYYGGSVSTWFQRNIDLSAYSGQTVQIGFRLVERGAGATTDGWYIDDVSIPGAVVTPDTIVILDEDFENGAPGWTREGTWARITSDYHSYNHCMTDSPDGNYPADAYTALISPYLKLPTATPIILTFWNHYQFANHNGTSWDDYGYVQITTDGGLNWDNLTYYGGSVSTWFQRNIDLSDYSGQTVKIGFRLVERGAGATTDGWYIDDIVIEAPFKCFADVPPGYWAEEAICKIYDEGITQGCSKNPLKYCPKRDVTREQMAAFIVRAVEGEPPANYCDTGSPFSDVPSTSVFCKYIKRLSEMGITQGCGGGKFCPKTIVTREQMAAFLVRAVEGEPDANYCDTGSPFSDVSPASVFCKYIKRLSELEITKGCGGDKYCPKTTVKRDQMAVFLDRAFLEMD